MMHLAPAQIDRMEFQRDSDDALARALAYAKQKRADDRAKMLAVTVSDARSKTLIERWDQDAEERDARQNLKTRRKDAQQQKVLQNRTTRSKPPTSSTARQGSPSSRRKYYAYAGSEMTIEELAAVASVGINTLRDRLGKGWPVEAAVETRVVKPTDRRAG